MITHSLEELNQITSDPIPRPLFDAPFQNTVAPLLGVGAVTVNRAGIATYIDRYSVVKDLASGEVGFDKDGVDLPPASTNITLYSEDLTHSVWTKNNTTISSNIVTSPDGLLTADKIVTDNSTDAQYAAQTVSVTSGDIYCSSIFVKADGIDYVQLGFGAGGFGETYANFDLINGIKGSSQNIIDYDIISLSDGWYRIWATATATNSQLTFCNIISPQESATATFLQSISGDGVLGLYAWGGQTEQLQFATPYIPTTATIVARLGATLTFPYFDNFPGSLKDKTVVFDIKVIGSKNPFSESFDSGDLSIRMSTGTANDKKAYIYMSNDDTSGSSTFSEEIFRIGCTYKSNKETLSMYFNGIIEAQNTTAISTDNSLSNITIGSSSLYIKIKNLQIYDVCLTEEQMKIA